MLNRNHSSPKLAKKQRKLQAVYWEQIRLDKIRKKEFISWYYVPITKTLGDKQAMKAWFGIYCELGGKVILDC